ncbi:hypothetical protein GCM10011352_20740 [Marinobacterium zhoushanense]|uniref:DUF2796 domain-containing protein n=1 Tax=Marinobacterium zhoushanense TaxID=1679163 RepID=A0ABQ1KC96_9GAMM|nr:DUF2796 domain-containing protein [Marinobacterium zhoushanense]GGB94530.1 hypothetical protein GCM10011352_20740 [Marinobacterium zhoushanense]
MSIPQKLGTVLLATLIASPTFAEDSFNSHVHGNAALQLAFRNQELVIYLRGAAVDLLGSEHQPFSAEASSRDQALERAMRSPAYWIELPAAADCTLSQVHLGKHHVISGRGVAPEVMDSTADSVVAEHLDLNFTYSFLCANPQRFDSAKIKLFEHFPTLETVQVKIAGEKQTRQQLTPADTVLRMP